MLPNTFKLLEGIKNIRAAGFSAFEPGFLIGDHNDRPQDEVLCNYYRVHIPLIIPKNNNDYKKNFLDECDIDGEYSVIKVINGNIVEHRLWNDNCFFAFNQNLTHSAWNKTKEYRIIMIIDIFINDKTL